jgi:hypothetical protein
MRSSRAGQGKPDRVIDETTEPLEKSRRSRQGGILMFPSRSPSSRLILTALLLGSALSGPTALAQDGDRAEDLARQAKERANLSPGQIEAICEFASNAGPNPARDRLESFLTLKIEHIERTCGITEGQWKKLQLAGRGDIKRYFDRVGDLKASLRLTRERQFGELQPEINRLRGRIQPGFFDDRSLFAKTRNQTLSEEQNARLAASLDESKRFRLRAKVDLVVDLFDMCVGFRDEQKDRLTKLLLEELHLPRSQRSGSDEIAVLILQAIKLPESKLRPIFEDSQWRSLRHLFKKLKANMENQVAAAEPEGADRDRPVDPKEGPAQKAAPSSPQENDGKPAD